MRHLAGLLLCTGVLWASFSALGTENEAVPLGVRDFTHTEAHLNVTRVSPEQTTISLESPAVVSQTEIVDYQSYQQFGIAGEQSLLEEGSPTVPQVARFYRIPNTGGADLVITDAEYDVVDNVNPLPVQLEETGFRSLTRNEAIYTKDAWYPENVAVMSDPMIMRDFRVVTVTLYPVQINPVTHQARIYRRLSADVVANNQSGINELLNPRRPSGAWASVYRGMISNLDDDALDNMTTTPGTYMIVTNSNSNIRPWADSLAEWKTRAGYRVYIASQATWSGTQVVTAITQQYQTADPPLEFVCLMGDPGWSGIGIPAGPGTYDYDHAYANMTSGDNIEDIGVGRLSGQSSSTMACINAKIMQYERTPHMLTGAGAVDTTWYHKSFLYAGVNQGCAGNYLIMRWAKDQFLRHTGVYLDSVAVHTGDAVDQNLVQNEVNSGLAFFLWRGTWVGGMSSTIASGTNPGGRFPVTMTITCMAGEYVGSGISSPAEDFLCEGTAANPKGGVSGVGTSTDGTQNGANGILAAGMIYAITDAEVENLGTVCASAKAQLYSAYGPNVMDTSPYTTSGPLALHFTEFFNLLGDPGLSMWTDVPESLTVVHPATLNIGARAVDVTVNLRAAGTPLQDAVVCLWKKGPDSTWVRGTTDANGHVTLPVSVNTTGNMYVTVTKKNCVPYLYTIPCGQTDCMPMYSSLVLDDDNVGGTVGNGDHVMNPGETIDLPVYIKNFGNVSSATGVSATLTSTDPRISVITGSAAFPDIAVGDSAHSTTPYRIQVSNYLQHQDQVLLTVRITSSAGLTVGAIPLTCVAGQALYMRQALSTPLNPGSSANLSIVVKNSGALPMLGVTGYLTSLSSFIQITTATASFGDVAVGALDSNSANLFVVAANPMAFRGLQAPLQLVLTTSSGFSDTVLFNVSAGTAQTTDPTGPDAYGYYAYDNTDTSYEMHPTYGYVDISSSGGTLLSAPSSDPGDKTSYTADYSAAHRLPFGFKFYGQVYDTLTISANGWAAFGNQSYLDMFRHYQIPAMGTPDALLAPFFSDIKTSGTGKGVWVMDDAANHRCIVQWKAFAWSAACTPEEGSPGANFTSPLDFELILYDTTYTPTRDGNGEIVFQYNTVTMNLNNEYCDEPAGSTIGVQKPGNLIGLQYAYQSTYSPGAATVTSGRAITFTTESRQMFGNVQGTVRNAADNLPLPGVTIGINGYAYQTTTDSAGHYLIPEVLTGTYGLHASLYRFNTDSVANQEVLLDSTITVNFNLHHPGMTLSVDSLTNTIGEAPGQSTFDITNAGNGPLDYNIQIRFAGGHIPTPWDSVGNVDASQICGNDGMWGCEFFGDHWWVTGSGNGGQNLLYRFDLNGALVDSVTQPSTSVFGWYDLACDGHYLYGSDSHSLIGIDTTGAVRDSIPSPLNPSRAIAYDSLTGHFWVADYTSDIYEIDRQGNIVHQVANSPSLSITGMAWDASDTTGYKLCILSQDGTSHTRLTKMRPVPPFSRRTVVDLPALEGDRAGGCAITPGWNSTLLVLGTIMRGADGPDHLEMYQITFNSVWISPTPAQGSVPGGNSQTITVHFDSGSLRDGSYRVNLLVASAVYDSSVMVPVHLIVDRATSAGNHVSLLPAQYALHQNYPNPFNPTTNIRYELKTEGLTRLAVFNILGEKVADLVNAKQPAGFYDVHFDASQLPSGVYFYRLSSGGFVQSEKMILLK